MGVKHVWMGEKKIWAFGKYIFCNILGVCFLRVLGWSRNCFMHGKGRCLSALFFFST